MTPTTIGERIAWELEADPDKSAAACAKFAGLSKSTLSELIKGRSKSSTKLHLIAEYLGVTTKWLETGKGPKHPVARAVVGVSDFDETSPQTPSRRVPVRGTASMGMEGYWVDLEYPVGDGDGYFEHPTRDPDAYVLRVKGDSMHPAIRSGWYVLVEPNAEPQQGEYVLVKLNDGRSTVKELLWHRNGEYSLLAISNDARMTVPEEQVEGIYSIAAVLPPSRRRL